MVILKIFRPKNIPNRKANWNWRVRFYHWALMHLMPFYKRCAISDTVNMGDLLVIHNVRDYWYEQELQRFRIDTAQHLEKQSTPYNITRKYRRSCFFNWSESLLIFHDGKSYNIRRTDMYSIETDIDGQFKVSMAKDFILRSDFVIKATISQKTNIRKELTITSPNSQACRGPHQQRVFMKDTIPEGQAHSKLDAKTIKYRGFEENELF